MATVALPASDSVNSMAAPSSGAVEAQAQPLTANNTSNSSNGETPKTDTTPTTSTAAPFHVLLLSGANRSPHKLKLKKEKGGSNQQSSSSSDHYNEFVHENDSLDDYLFRRNEFRRKKKAASSQPQKFQPVKVESSKSEEEGDDASLASLRRLASPLEIAMADCCERAIPSVDGHSGEEGSHWSANQHHVRHHRLHRPLAPANCADQDDDMNIPALPCNSGSPPRKKARPWDNKAGSSTDNNSNNNVNDNCNNEAGILRSGEEGHFLKLLLMYCPKHAVGHRALSIAILQRTVDWESSSSSKTSNTGNNSKGQITIRTESKENHRHNNIRATRIKSFLIAGGMKLLARWLVDSYTAVPTSPSNQRKVDKHTLAPTHSASPTGCLLLPLLHLLKSIPFDKAIVVEAQIHKSIKRLKKALAKLAQGLDPTILEKKVHPISGGLSVGKVIAAVDAVMSSWSRAAEANATMSDETRRIFDPFREQRMTIQSRFNDLAKFYNGEDDPPEWLPRSILGMRRAVAVSIAVKKQSKPLPPPLHATTTTSNNNNTAKESQSSNGNWASVRESSAPRSTGTIQGLMSRKRPGSAALFIEPPKMGTTQKQRKLGKKVSWTDRPKNRLVPPRPLREERIFVKDTDVWQEDSLVPDEMMLAGNNNSNLDDIAARAAEALHDLPPAGGIKVEDNVVEYQDESAAREAVWETVANDAIKAEEDNYGDDSDMEDLF